MSRPLVPKGGNDRIYTPRLLAQSIVEHFAPSGSLLEPCKGEGAFVKAMAGYGAVFACEIDEGTDFFDFASRVDWVITNPPWSQFRAFLRHAMSLADNVVFLALMNAWFMRARVQDVRNAGFGYVESLLLPTPPKPWPQTGFQLAAVHIRKSHTGPMKITHV